MLENIKDGSILKQNNQNTALKRNRKLYFVYSAFYKHDNSHWENMKKICEWGMTKQILQILHLIRKLLSMQNILPAIYIFLELHKHLFDTKLIVKYVAFNKWPKIFQENTRNHPNSVAVNKNPFLRLATD